MRAVIQRVSRAKVTSGGEILGAIGPGLVVFLGIHGNDGPDEIQWMADKILGLRIFEDEDGKMNRSLLDIGREILIVSQFTLYGDCRKGRRPGFTDAAPPAHAEPVYQRFIKEIRQRGIGAAAGRFQAFMAVELVNDGPVTLLVDSDKLF
ncbi:D-tyrosyl-tRNA(Tyr) deacylase [Desulfoprunum benzoelyticum]|jgi:D-tyrosyl-tRNA(Tyr) deacylase|uniref:D-aminoacyl-tRNA deacylase n=1 Tax=Desulfoprunum benzoelyticum TaxID=1506996 RepID=A0A840UTM9_9BACT|nr:D-aminoacyl-tRNA deacylase [Desulfoprunum benzoelyticum]MBB5348196.1 D-tyrosyl-tRNA(Tyr) deacylase [Desulfoprunum benzoelyticum]MBM9530876.1 D-tyrosyl-tRNA(Tyr) deacylase [Desulfoprunum benzoelyticum]